MICTSATKCQRHLSAMMLQSLLQSCGCNVIPPAVAALNLHAQESLGCAGGVKKICICMHMRTQTRTPLRLSAKCQRDLRSDRPSAKCQTGLRPIIFPFSLPYRYPFPFPFSLPFPFLWPFSFSSLFSFSLSLPLYQSSHANSTEVLGTGEFSNGAAEPIATCW